MACRSCNKAPQPRTNMMAPAANPNPATPQVQPPAPIYPGENMLGGAGGFGGQGSAQNLQQQLQSLQSFVNPGGQGTINYQQPGANNSGWQNFKEGVRNFFVGEPGQALQFPNYTPLQQGALNQLLLQGSQNSNFSGIENLARKNFQTQTIPTIAERFAGMGQNKGSGGLVGQLGAAGADLESQLAALRGQYGLQQLQYGLQPQYQNAYIPRSGGVLQALPQAAAMYFGVR